jgi:hypothetical protein
VSFGPVYSRRLFSQQGVSLPTTAFTASPSQVLVVRSIDCYVGAPAVSTQLIFKDLDESTAWLSFTAELGQSRSFTWVGRQVYEPGQSLELQPLDHPWDVRISGYELSVAV